MSQFPCQTKTMSDKFVLDVRTFHMQLKLATVIFAAVVLAGCSSTEQPQATEAPQESDAALHKGWTFEGLSPLGIAGVSPEAILEGGTVYLYSTDMGIKLYKSQDGLTFEPVNAQMPMGADPTLIKTPAGKWNMYYTDILMTGPMPAPGTKPEPPDPKKSQKTIKVTTSDSLENFMNGTDTGIVQAKPGAAWGVPDTFVDPSGDTRMLWVDMQEGERWEVIKSGTSKDGLNFTEDEGIRFSDAYVDPYLLKAEANDWVALLSTTPDDSRLPQKMFFAWSTDGMTWEVDPEPIINDSEKNYLDPTGYELSPGVWRIYVSTSDKPNAIGGPYSLETFVLKAPSK